MEQLINSELLPSWWDESYYLAENPDVEAEVKKGAFESGYKHFVEYGIGESRNPNRGFNAQYYLDKNHDVAEAVRNGTIASAFEHWLLYGQQENRQATPDGTIVPQNKLDGNQEPANIQVSKNNQKDEISQSLDKNLANSPLNQSFGWVGENALKPERLQAHLPTCECIGCRSLVVNDELMVPNTLVGKANPLTSLPLLSSNPNATAKIFLDFDSHITSNTAWNNNYTGGADIFTPAYSIDSDTNSFSDQEIANIEEIWKRVAEDFAPFNVDVTTIDPGNLNQSNNMRVAIGGAWQNWFGSSAGGVAYIGSWQWNSDTPTFVFEDNLANGLTKYTAEAISHEVGHTLGLYHQSTYDAFGNKTAEYNPGGFDSNGISWAPIMGVSYYNSLTTWHNGQNSQGYNIYQDDLAVITRPSNGFGYRLDDHGNTNNTATVLSGNPTISTSGIISTTNDVDVFSFTTGAGQITLNVNGAEFSPNLDVIAELWDSSGTLIASNNPAELLSANITTSVPAGDFFLHIKSNELYGRVGQYNISGTINPVTVPNDNFVNRISLTSPTTTGTNVNATKESGEPNHGGNVGGKSVWWSWTAPASGNFTLSTAGSNFDTLLGLYTGSDVSGLTQIGGNDDSNGTLQSQVTFDAVAGTAYQIAVDGYRYYGSDAVSGNIALQLAPTNDNFVNLFTLSGSSASAIGSNVFASKETGEPNHGNVPGGKSVWWSWTAPVSGNVTFSTAGSNFDTLLGVYTGSDVAGLSLIAGNDDSNNTLQSQVTFNAVAGTDYKIAVDGFGSGETASAGAIALNLEQDIPATAEIQGLKWNDLNGNSTRDLDEPGLSGWTIYLDQNQNSVLDPGEISTTTDSSGNYAFTGLAAGTYTVAEVMQEGWEQTYPNISEDSSTEPIALSTTNSPVPISTYGEIVKSSINEEINPLTDVSGPLINLDDFRADPRFAGINGNGFSTVILDTGIDLNHPYFGPDSNSDGVADRIVYQYDFANGDADASDYDGHGSNVSSIVASSDSVHTGMAPGADIIHLKVFTDSGSGNFSYVEQALQWVVANADTYNIASVNMSLGDSQNWNTGQTLYGISDEIAALAAKDVMVVSAAGNDFYGFGSGQGVSYPAADPNSLAVGAAYDSNAGGFTYSSGAQAYTTGADRITPFSQRHSTLTSIFAPGAPITGAGPTGGTVTMHGTSQASPHIAGIAALAQQLAEQTIDRRLTPEEFQNLLSTTGVTINDGDDEDDNVVNTGLNFKRVDMMALGEAILAMDNGNPPGTHTVHLSPGEVVTGKDFGNKLSDDSSPFINPQTPNWKVQATKDFNGDGKGDIFWRDESNGNNQLWLMNGRTVSSSENINALSANWEVQGVNDFNGDSKADILWRDPATGQNTLWLMDGATVDSATAINPAAINWQVEATDDFNGDGKADIFWHDPVTGQNALWLMNGSTRIDSGNFSGARTAWQVEATDDFNGDSKADILWRNASTGQNSIWLMDGLSVISGRNITGAQLNWEVESTDDFNGDGKADIVWRKATTGENQVWLVDGTTVTSLENISSAASNWQIQGTSDFNNDSKADILWRDPATGQNAMWLMDGLNNPTGPLLV